MKYAILSDVHASVEALSAVLADARAEGARSVVCLGDVVGYHADPEACIALLRAHDAIAIAGNHDRVAAGLAEPDDFGEAARRAILWTRARLSPDERAYLAALPLTRVVDGRFLLFHGALHPAPNADLHLSRAARVRCSMQALADGPWGVRLAFFGHTHRAAVHAARDGVVASPDARAGSAEGGTVLSEGSHYLVNPGSVGQPRDGDPRAAYAIFDADAALLDLRRVPFDRAACSAKAAAAGLVAEEAPRGAIARLVALARRLA